MIHFYRILCTVILFTLPCTIAFSQVPQLQWAAVYGSKSGEEGVTVITDAAGNVYTYGLYTDTSDFDPGPGVFELTSPDQVAIYLQKLDAAGNFVWAKSISGSSYESAGQLVFDAAGNFYLCGGYSDTTDLDPGPGISREISKGGYDVFIVKLDVNGDFLWGKSIHSPNSELTYTLATDSAGNVYTTGIFADTVDFDPGPGIAYLNGASGDLDAFILKLDTDGNYQWARRMGEGSSDVGAAIAVDPAGNVFSSGYFQGVVDFDPGPGTTELTSFGVSDIFIQKFNTNGDFQWVKQVGGNSSDIVYSLAVDGSGNILATGLATNVVDFDPGTDTFALGSVSSSNGFVLKLKANGDFDWATAISGKKDNVGKFIATDQADNIYVTGYFQDTIQIAPSTSLYSKGSYDGFVLKLDPSGTTQWGRNFGGPDYDVLLSVSVDNSGNTYLTGAFIDSADADPGAGVDFVRSNNGGLDAITLKWGNCTPTYSTLVETVSCTNYTAPGGSVFTRSGTYEVTVPNSTGCDSIITIHLTVNPPYTIHLKDTICEGSTYTFNGTGYTASGTYTDSLTSIYGCDSITTLSLVVLPNRIDTITKSVCQGGTFHFNGTDYTSSGTYTANLQTTHGCDSTVTLELTVYQTAVTSLADTICAGETRTFNGITYSTSGTYTANLHTIHGCDSTVTFQLVVNPAVQTTLDKVICFGESYSFRGTDYFTTGIYADTLQQVASGCDSIITLHLVVLPENTSTTTTSICEGVIYTFNGTGYTTSGTYTAILQSVVSGCDSTATLHLTVNSVNTQVTQVNPITLTASATGATYNWLNCNTGFSTTGESGATFTAAGNGNFAVRVSQNGCIDTSACFLITEVGLTENVTADWTVYPVPASDEVTLFTTGISPGLVYFLYDQVGKLVLSGPLTGTKTTIPLSTLEGGVYNLFIPGDAGQRAKKIVKE